MIGESAKEEESETQGILLANVFYYKLGWWHGGKDALHTILNLFK